MTAKRIWRPFTPEEDAALQDYIVAEPADRQSLAAIGRRFNRSKASIQVRLRKLQQQRPEPEKPQPMGERPCVRCGTIFTRTIRRRLLCAYCFANAE